MKAQFLNVDLEIVSSSKLDAFAAEMGRRVVILHSGPATKPKHYLLTIESSRHFRNPDSVIHALCSVIESLSPASCRIWQRAQKTFDVGYELQQSDHSLRFSLRPDTLQRVAVLGASLTVTCYQDKEMPNHPLLATPLCGAPELCR